MQIYQPLASCDQIYEDWVGSEARGFSPTQRQQILIDVVRAALQAGCHYDDDVMAHCARALSVPQDQLDAGRASVHGGHFGYDLYYARRYLYAVKRISDENDAHAALKPAIGQNLGTLIFNSDFKQLTSVTVIAVEGMAVKLEGKRGASRWTVTTTAVGIKSAIERAHERGRRKDDFAAFCGTAQLSFA